MNTEIKYIIEASICSVVLYQWNKYLRKREEIFILKLIEYKYRGRNFDIKQFLRT